MDIFNMQLYALIKIILCKFKICIFSHPKMFLFVRHIISVSVNEVMIEYNKTLFFNP